MCCYGCWSFVRATLLDNTMPGVRQASEERVLGWRDIRAAFEVRYSIDIGIIYSNNFRGRLFCC